MVAKNMPFDMAFKIKAPASAQNAANVRSGSKAPFRPSASHFRSNPINGRHQTGPVGPVSAKRGSGPPYSIISSTRARSVGGIVMPSDHCTAPMPTAPIQNQVRLKRGKQHVLPARMTTVISQAEDLPRPHPLDCSGTSDGQTRRRSDRRRPVRWALGPYRRCRQCSALCRI
jgi:hypothetical protein